MHHINEVKADLHRVGQELYMLDTHDMLNQTRKSKLN